MGSCALFARPFAPLKNGPPLFAPWVTMGGPPICGWGHPSAQPIKIGNRATPYRSAKHPAPKSARESAWRGAGQKRGAHGSAWESARPPCSQKKHKGQALFRALPRAPRFWPAPLQALSRALLGGWGFCTSEGGRPVCNPLNPIYRESQKLLSVAEAGDTTLSQIWKVRVCQTTPQNLDGRNRAIQIKNR